MPAAMVAANTLVRRTDAWRSLLGTERVDVLVAESEGRILGLAAICPARDADADPAAVGELAAIYVDPPECGRGHGSALNRAALERLRATGFTEATLWVLSANAEARGFYEHHGWRLDGAEEHEPAGLHKVRYRIAL